MQNDMRDRISKLLEQGIFSMTKQMEIEEWCDFLADHLIANGVIVLDMKVLSPKNIPLITHFANMPLDKVFDLIQKDIVMCADCKHSLKNPDINNTCYLTCNMKNGIQGTIAPDDYCSYGKGKNNE